MTAVLMEIVDNLETIVMDRMTPFKANFPAIKEPRFHDNTILINSQVGIHNKVVCLYVNAKGQRVFPEPLYLSKRVAMRYKPFNMPTAAGGVMKLRAIPIHEFKILKVSERSIHDF